MSVIIGHGRYATYRRMWIILELTDQQYRRIVYEKVAGIVEEMDGEVLQSSSFADVVVTARFPHRQYRGVEKAIADGVSTMPVKRTIVCGYDPYRPFGKDISLTQELYDRQDEVLFETR